MLHAVNFFLLIILIFVIPFAWTCTNDFTLFGNALPEQGHDQEGDPPLRRFAFMRALRVRRQRRFARTGARKESRI